MFILLLKHYVLHERSSAANISNNMQHTSDIQNMKLVHGQLRCHRLQTISHHLFIFFASFSLSSASEEALFRLCTCEDRSSAPSYGETPKSVVSRENSEPE